MNIGQFAEVTGLSAHTLRYYEKIDLLTPVSRDSSGHRQFSKKDIEWVAFIKRLKQTGMPLKGIKEYAVLRSEGDATLALRQRLLASHAEFLAQKIKDDQQNLLALEQKLAWYAERLDH